MDYKKPLSQFYMTERAHKPDDIRFIVKPPPIEELLLKDAACRYADMEAIARMGFANKAVQEDIALRYTGDHIPITSTISKTTLWTLKAMD